MTSGLTGDHPTSEDVAAREFAPARKGYDREEVRDFLQMVASALTDANDRVADLQRRLVRATVDSVGSEPATDEVDEFVLEAVSAEAWRDDVLADLDRRRRELNAEILRLRAGRDRLRVDLSAVLSGVSEQLRLLDGALVAARDAGDLEEQKARDKPPLSLAESRAELEAARLAGFVTVGPVTHEDAEVEDRDTAKAEVPEPADALEEGEDGVGALFERLRAERTSDRPATTGGARPEG